MRDTSSGRHIMEIFMKDDGHFLRLFVEDNKLNMEYISEYQVGCDESHRFLIIQSCWIINNGFIQARRFLKDVRMNIIKWCEISHPTCFEKTKPIFERNK